MLTFVSDERLLRMSSYLAPAYLRIGGNLADRLYFSEPDNEFPVNIQSLESCSNGDEQYCSFNFTNFTMTGVYKVKQPSVLIFFCNKKLAKW